MNNKNYYTAKDYIENPDLFVPAWADKRKTKVPEKMLDFEERWKEFHSPNGRLMCSAHRGEHVFYPECSTEAFLSAILLGADLLEVDIVPSKDNVLMVVHDDTLTRTTNVTKLREAGVEGLPESDRVADWTFEQLRQLRLLREGGSDEVTNYIIPTFEDIVMLAKDRCFITLDKTHRFDWGLDMLPLMEKHNAYRNVMIPYNYTCNYGLDRIKELMDQVEAASGYPSALMTRSINVNCLKWAAGVIEEYHYPKVLRCGEYNEEEAEVYKPYNEKYRVHIECLRAWHDTPEVWDQIIKDGFNLIVTNDMLGMSELIEKNHFE